ncbi:hypothetical protein DENSPDRAFT_886943 [Dentipellis sp. KUC8613]|nr:hypothetical protein DENSPDRAFT_886943 [Dentipellis sp. KUC8613]
MYTAKVPKDEAGDNANKPGEREIPEHVSNETGGMADALPASLASAAAPVPLVARVPAPIAQVAEAPMPDALVASAPAPAPLAASATAFAPPVASTRVADPLTSAPAVFESRVPAAAVPGPLAATTTVSDTSVVAHESGGHGSYGSAALSKEIGTQPSVATREVDHGRLIGPYPWKKTVKDGGPVIEIMGSDEDMPEEPKRHKGPKATDVSDSKVPKQPAPKEDNGSSDAEPSRGKKRFRSLKGKAKAPPVVIDLTATSPSPPPTPSREEVEQFFAKARQPPSPTTAAHRNGDFLAVVKGPECGVLCRPSRSLWNAIKRDPLSASKRFATMDAAAAWFNQNY